MTPEELTLSILALVCLTLGAAAAVAGFRVPLFRHTAWQFAAAGLGMLFKTAAIGVACHQNTTHFFNSPSEIAGLLAWALTFSYLVALAAAAARSLGALILPLVVLLLAFSIFSSRDTVDPGVQAGWTLATHILSAFLGYGLLLTACFAGLLYLEQASLLKRKIFGVLFKELPSLERLERLEFLCALLGFALFTVAIGTGALMAHEVRKPFWLDPKVIATQTTWLVFAVLVAGRLLGRLHGKAAAKFVLLGAVLVLLTFALSHPFARPPADAAPPPPQALVRPGARV